MSLLLDTSVLLLEAEKRRFVEQDVSTSIICCGEILAIALKRKWGSRRLQIVGDLLKSIRVHAWTSKNSAAIARCYADCYLATHSKEAQNDCWIVATAMAHDLAVVTADRGMMSIATDVGCKSILIENL